MAPRITLIACISADRGLGYQGQLLFRIPDDLARFKKTTEGHTVVMGRKTAESLGNKPLPGRTNIVLTRQREDDELWGSRGFIPLGTVEDVLAHTAPEAEIFIIGGAEIYHLFMPIAQRVLITRVGTNPTADTWFPPLLPSKAWKSSTSEVVNSTPAVPSHWYEDWKKVGT